METISLYEASIEKHSPHEAGARIVVAKLNKRMKQLVANCGHKAKRGKFG